jgi:hypothetical protein
MKKLNNLPKSILELAKSKPDEFINITDIDFEVADYNNYQVIYKCDNKVYFTKIEINELKLKSKKIYNYYIIEGEQTYSKDTYYLLYSTSNSLNDVLIKFLKEK